MFAGLSANTTDNLLEITLIAFVWYAFGQTFREIYMSNDDVVCIRCAEIPYFELCWLQSVVLTNAMPLLLFSVAVRTSPHCQCHCYVYQLLYQLLRQKQRQKTVISAYFTSKQKLSFGLAEQYFNLCCNSYEIHQQLTQ